MLLLSLCALAHSATCSPGTCNPWPVILAFSYLTTSHLSRGLHSAFLGSGSNTQRESTGVSGIRIVPLRGVSGIRGGQGPRLTMINETTIKALSHLASFLDKSTCQVCNFLDQVVWQLEQVTWSSYKITWANALERCERVKITWATCQVTWSSDLIKWLDQVFSLDVTRK